MLREELILSDRPEGLTEVLNAAEKLLAKVERRVEKPVRRRSRRKATEEVLWLSAELLQVYLGHVNELSYDINDLNYVMYGMAPEERDIPGAMARIESHVDDVLDMHRAIRGWRAEHLGAEGRDILVAIYRHLLGEVQSWLRGLIEALNDPIGALERQGTPIVPGVVRLRIKAFFDTPPQMTALEAWARRCLPRE